MIKSKWVVHRNDLLLLWWWNPQHPHNKTEGDSAMLRLLDLKVMHE